METTKTLITLTELLILNPVSQVRKSSLSTKFKERKKSLLRWRYHAEACSGWRSSFSRLGNIARKDEPLATVRFDRLKNQTPDLTHRQQLA